MNKFRKLLVRFKNLNDLQKFYKLEFTNLKKFNSYNIRINYRKSNVNNISLYGYDNKLKFKSEIFSQKVINKLFSLIDKMPMRKYDKQLALHFNRHSICGLVSNYDTSHCFGDYTHQTCCLLGNKARKYSNETGNPIGKISEKTFYEYFGKKPKSNDLTPWCSCIGSKVCSFYAQKFNDGTHIKFVNDLDNKFIIYGFNTKCEKKIASLLNFNSHLTPGIDNTYSYSTNDCKYNKIKI